MFEKLSWDAYDACTQNGIVSSLLELKIESSEIIGQVNNLQNSGSKKERR